MLALGVGGVICTAASKTSLAPDGSTDAYWTVQQSRNLQRKALQTDAQIPCSNLRHKACSRQKLRCILDCMAKA